MIHSVSGDILFSKADLIAHGVAPLDDFKSGLALALREKYPSMYKDFRHYCKTLSPKAGTAWLWAGVGEGGKAVKIAALLTQEPPRKDGEHPSASRPFAHAAAGDSDGSATAAKIIVASRGNRSSSAPRLSAAPSDRAGRRHRSISASWPAVSESRPRRESLRSTAATASSVWSIVRSWCGRRRPAS